ncbi:MAG: 4Fe-4S dicluster domain-containing protein [Candidatus Omnitrophota bacterium]
MKRLFVDLDICDKCEVCKVACQYFYHPQNNGVANLREYATFATFCRHCEQAPCVTSCYHDALERQSDGHLKRYKMRCTSCKSCTIACPFGTIFIDFIPYLDSKCDYCLGISERTIPSCVKTCPHDAISYKDIDKEDIDNNLFFIGDNLAVHTIKWSREEAVKKRK